MISLLAHTCSDIQSIHAIVKYLKFRQIHEPKTVMVRQKICPGAPTNKSTIRKIDTEN